MRKIVNAYIVYYLDVWSRNATNNFKFKNCLFGATNTAQNSDKEKYVYSGYGIIFDSTGSWSFDNDFSGNVMIFDVDNSSLFHSDNRKNNFLILGEGAAYAISESFGSPEKKLIILILLKQTQNFVWFFIIMLIIVIFLLMEKRHFNLKLARKMLTFLLNFVSEVHVMDLPLLRLVKYL